MKTLSSLTFLVFLSVLAFGILGEDVTYEGLFSLDPKNYENKCLDMGNVITNLDVAINEINKIDIGQIKLSRQQIDKIKPTLIEMKTHCEEYLKKKEDESLEDFAANSKFQEQKLSRDQFQISLEEADKNRLKLEQKLDKINQQKSQKMKENFNSAAVAKDQWLVENGATQEQMDASKVTDNFDDSIEALDQFEDAYGVIHEDNEERDQARQQFLAAQKVPEVQITETPAQNQLIQGKKHKLKNQKEAKIAKPETKEEPEKNKKQKKEAVKEESKKEAPNQSSLSTKKLEEKIELKIIAQQVAQQKTAKKQLKLQQQKELQEKMISFQNTEIKFHEKMKHLQKILKTEMKGMKFDKKSNEAPATALSSAKFLERTVFVEFLSVLTQTANSVNSMQENKLAQNLALLQVKIEEVTKMFQTQQNYYDNVQQLIDKKDAITQMMKSQC